MNREELMSHLFKAGIQTRPVWFPNHRQKPYNNCQTYNIDSAESMVSESLCLPSSSNITVEEQDFVIKKIINFIK